MSTLFPLCDTSHQACVAFRGYNLVSPGRSHGEREGDEGPEVRVHGLRVLITRTMKHTNQRCHAVRTCTSLDFVFIQ